ncbi:N-acetylmuramoyl-L-alanine amidase family protein [Streptococcus mitis]|jgi:choline binding protein J|uniref:N-acetylmuramoyl-L-alanine amidase family protein n=1 Tax=Streptococcus mitis TaxID=28037 RepID=UPI0020009597|nr:N-acetylmuramoyl-L-alanine amidase family protein [Streptococcus mitis]
MKKEMKRALVALGLSTLLVPTFANQVVYAQEESHETTTSVSPEEVRKEVNKIKESYKELQDKNKQKILNEIEKVDWKTISFSQDDVNEIKNKISEILSNHTQWFFESLKRQEEEILNSSFYLEYWKERLYSINPSSRDELYEIESIKRGISEEILHIATLKKKDHIISYIKKNPYYTNIEREKMLKQASLVYVSYGGPGGPGWISTFYKVSDLNEYLKKIASLLSDDFQAVSLIPTEKNIREVNAVAFMEKTAISNDDTLSKADKVSMFSKIDDIVEEAVRKIKTEADIYEDGNYKNSRMLSPEELSVFTKRIEGVYQGKAKPKVTKEEAIQAVSTGTSSSVSTSTSSSTSSQSIVTSNGETKKNNWFKESGKWYYNDLSGNLVRNRWVGRYYLKADASMAASEWIYDEDYKGWFYVDSTGSYVEKAWQGEYYLKRGGYMAKSEWVFDSQYDSWYYLNQDGKYARNQWIKDGDKWYYLLADGKLAKNMTINGYKVNEKGEWV